MDPIMYVVLFVVAMPVLIFLMSIRILRPTHRGLVERLGRYRRLAAGGGGPEDTERETTTGRCRGRWPRGV
jgi:hypothetical protein